MTASGRLRERRIILVGRGRPGLGRKMALQCAAYGAKLVRAARSAPFLGGVTAETDAPVQ